MHLAAVWGPRLAGPSMLGRLGAGECWASASVGVVFTASSLAYMLVLRFADRIPLAEQFAAVLPPLLATAPMAVAVVALERALAAAAVSAPLRLAAEVSAGAVVFVPCALLFAPAASRELFALLRAARARRTSGAR
jgi:hypothetical protein